MKFSLITVFAFGIIAANSFSWAPSEYQCSPAGYFLLDEFSQSMCPAGSRELAAAVRRKTTKAIPPIVTKTDSVTNLGKTTTSFNYTDAPVQKKELLPTPSPLPKKKAAKSPSKTFHRSNILVKTRKASAPRRKVSRTRTAPSYDHNSPKRLPVRKTLPPPPRTSNLPARIPYRRPVPQAKGPITKPNNVGVILRKPVTNSRPVVLPKRNLDDSRSNVPRKQNYTTPAFSSGLNNGQLSDTSPSKSPKRLKKFRRKHHEQLWRKKQRFAPKHVQSYQSDSVGTLPKINATLKDSPVVASTSILTLPQSDDKSPGSSLDYSLAEKGNVSYPVKHNSSLPVQNNSTLHIQDNSTFPISHNDTEAPGIVDYELEDAHLIPELIKLVHWIIVAVLSSVIGASALMLIHYAVLSRKRSLVKNKIKSRLISKILENKKLLEMKTLSNNSPPPTSALASPPPLQPRAHPNASRTDLSSCFADPVNLHTYKTLLNATEQLLNFSLVPTPIYENVMVEGTPSPIPNASAGVEPEKEKTKPVSGNLSSAFPLTLQKDSSAKNTPEIDIPLPEAKPILAAASMELTDLQEKALDRKAARVAAFEKKEQAKWKVVMEKEKKTTDKLAVKEEKLKSKNEKTAAKVKAKEEKVQIKKDEKAAEVRKEIARVNKKMADRAAKRTSWTSLMKK